MFSIKNFTDEHETEYMAYAVPQYHKGLDFRKPDDEQGYSRLILFFADGRSETVPVNVVAYIENASGKTIDVVRGHVPSCAAVPHVRA